MVSATSVTNCDPGRREPEMKTSCLKVDALQGDGSIHIRHVAPSQLPWGLIRPVHKPKSCATYHRRSGSSEKKSCTSWQDDALTPSRKSRKNTAPWTPGTHKPHKAASESASSAFLQLSGQGGMNNFYAWRCNCQGFQGGSSAICRLRWELGPFQAFGTPLKLLKGRKALMEAGS